MFNHGSTDSAPAIHGVSERRAVMPRGRGTYSDEPNDKARDRQREGERSEHHDVAPDEQSSEHAQEPPD